MIRSVGHRRSIFALGRSRRQRAEVDGERCEKWREPTVHFAPSFVSAPRVHAGVPEPIYVCLLCDSPLVKYIAGIGAYGASCCQATDVIHQRLSCQSNWIALIPRMNGCPSGDVRDSYVLKTCATDQNRSVRRAISDSKNDVDAKKSLRRAS